MSDKDKQKNDFKVSLISPPSRASSPRPPIGLMYLASSVREYLTGVDINIIDLKSQYGREDILDEIIRRLKMEKPDLVGISCLSTDMRDVKELAKRIKKEDSEIITVVGGIHPTLFPKYFFEDFDDVDFVVRGEGEVTLIKLITGIREKGDMYAVDGIGYKHKGEIIITGERDPVKDLDQIPFPAFDLVDMEYYTKPSEWVIRGVPISGFFIFTSRGCPYACKFCVNKNLSGRRVRLRSAKNVVDELEHLVKNYHIDGFFIYDDSFGLNKKRSIDICDEIVNKKLKLIWGCQARVNLISEDIIRKMKEAGCLQLEFGVESGSQKVLEQLRKQIKIEEVRSAFKLCKKYKMRTLSNFLINTPGETVNDIRDTLNLATEIGANVNLFNVTTLFPGSDLYYEFHETIPEEDMVKFASQGDIEDFFEIIESKYKLSAHKIPLTDLLDMIANKFPMRGRLILRWEKNYLAGMWKLISFIFEVRYLKVLFNSKRKKEYFKLFFTLIRHLY